MSCYFRFRNTESGYAKKYIYLFLVALLFSHATLSSELIYIPKKPNFGGNPLNANGLLANAQAQNKLTDPSSRSARPRTALERFTESIQSRAFSTLFSNAFTKHFGITLLEFEENWWELMENYLKS